MSVVRARAGLLLGLTLTVAAGARATPASAAACAAAKLILAGRMASARAVCDAKAAATGRASAACVTRLRARVVRRWSRGSCAGTGGEAALGSHVDAQAAELADLLELDGPPSRCTAGKVRHAGRKTACRLRCAARAVARGISLDAGSTVRCLDRCSRAFTVAFQRDEAKGRCHTTDDLDDVEFAVDDFVDQAVSGDWDDEVDEPGDDGDGPDEPDDPGGSATSTTTTATTSPATTTTTLAPCGGLFPLCSGGCPAGAVCTAGGLAQVCGCSVRP